jgi:hypothetical protein
VPKVRFESNLPIPGREREGLESLRVFGRLPVTGVRGCTEAGVRKASREETAGEFAPTLVSIYGEFAAAASPISECVGLPQSRLFNLAIRA